MADRPIARRIATLWFIGFSPVAPGTMGTLVAAAFVALVPMAPMVFIAATVAVTALGIWASQAVEDLTGEKDPGYVIIDEVAGFMVSMLLLPVTWGYLAAAFVLFRFFDILKPPPIRQLQSIKGGVGVMIDDIAAGAITCVLLHAWRLIA